MAGDTEISITANAVIEGQKKISTIKSLEEKQELQVHIFIILAVILVPILIIQIGFLFIRARISSSEDDEQLPIWEKVSTYVMMYGIIFLIILFLVQFWFVPLSSPEPPFGF